MIDAPMTMLTDYALAGVTGWLGWRLFLAREGQAVRSYWVLAFAALALAAALGGTYHGFASALTESEPPRDSRRLHFLRGWSYEDIEEVSC